MAVPPRPTRTPAANAPQANPNANLSISAARLAALRASEGQRNGGGAYNDTANNCTVGTGILVHAGPCSAAELAQPPDTEGNEATFQNRVHAAEAAVRSQVTDRALTQDQFDALVPTSFNLGATGAAPITAQANRNNDAGVWAEMRQRMYTHRHDSHGRPVGPPQYSPGLAKRREREALPFAAPEPRP